MVGTIDSAVTLFVRQRKELGEFIGFETRNKYEIQAEQGQILAFCAEQQKGVLGFLLRQYLGHWRSFELHFFDSNRQLLFTAKHPFRFFFQRLEIRGVNGELIGSLQQRFRMFSRRFDFLDELGKVGLVMRAGFFSFWTFPVYRGGSEVAKIRKKWSGGLVEAFTDADNFRVDFGPTLSVKERWLVLAASVFIDLQYFETRR